MLLQKYRTVVLAPKITAVDDNSSAENTGVTGQNNGAPTDYQDTYAPPLLIHNGCVPLVSLSAV